jgi:hypothetical protein
MVTADRRVKKKGADAAITPLLREIDDMISRKTRRLLADADPVVASRQRFSHQHISKSAMRNTDRLKSGAQHDKWLEKDPERARTSSFRIGGIGSVLAVSISSGAGTGFHYDNGDDGRYYSVIVVLETGGLLKLPELGLELVVKPGDVVPFLANE